jgi:NAD(P)-dependent dehydrogenase (short-subunit alcohol dehydrogenase family)
MTTTTSAPVALITGGTTGIGLATARVLHKRGYAVLVTGRNPDTLAAAKRELPEDVVVFGADARSITDAEAVAAELRDRFGRLDLAFLNAGIAQFTSLESLDENLYDQHFDINVKGQVFTLQKIAPLLGKGSSVIFTSSSITDLAMPGMSIYTATKSAQLGLVRTLAVDLAPRGIRVNAVSPGVIETAMFGKLGLPAEAIDGMRATMSPRIPTARFGVGEDVGQVVAFLASPEASYINGANIVVDGGLSVT